MLALRLLGLLLFFFISQPSTGANTAPVVIITGASDEQKGNIEAWLGKPRETCELPVLREHSMLRLVRKDVMRALQALGYYDADIKLDLLRKEECWALTIVVKAGEPVRITDVSLEINGEAAQDPAFIELLASEPVKKGDILNHARYEALKNQLLRLASDRGYFTSQLTRHTLSVNTAQKSAAIELHMESGSRYTFGHVHFEQDVLDETFLASFLPFSEGDEFDNQKVLNLRQSLSGSGYFADVRVQTGTPDNIALKVPLEVVVNAKPQYVYSAGIGFATDTGPRVRLGIENRRANRFGHRFGSELELSPVRSGIGGNYDIPLGDPNRERISFTSSYVHEEVEDHLSERYRLGAAHLRELDSKWIMTRGVDFEREYFIVGEQKDRTDLVLPGLEFSKVVADNPIFPQRGWRLNGKTRLSHEAIASSVTFLQMRGTAKYVMPMWHSRLLMRLESGATLADELIELPSSVRFFAGGDSSIRGYGYQSLGPREDAVNNSGDVIGGRHLLVASIEADMPFRENWSFAVFYDGGNAYDKLADFEPVYGRGTGIRWRSPIGPVRLDVAEPSDGADNFRLHVSMGMDL